MLDYPNILDNIFDKLQKYSAYPIIVGGFIRDALLGFESKDIDIEIYNIDSLTTLEDILAEFAKINSVGKSFGVLKLEYFGYQLDFALPREDNKVEAGHKGFQTNIKPNITFKDAALRRDFTINAMGYDPFKKELLDPFEGKTDLEKKILRVVDPFTFVEDPLRVLRAVQFSARYDLSIDNDTLQLCRKMCDDNLLHELPKERIFGELEKLFLKAKNISSGFLILKNFHALKYFPQLMKLNKQEWENTLSVLDQLVLQRTTNDKTNIVLMLCGVCYAMDIESSEKFVISLNGGKELLTRVLSILKNYKKIEEIHKNENKEYQLYMLACNANISELLLFAKAIYFSKHKNQKNYIAAQEIEKLALQLQILTKKMDPLLQGRDLIKLGLTPSIEFSEYLQDAYEAQMKGVFKSRTEALQWLKEYLVL